VIDSRFEFTVGTRDRALSEYVDHYHAERNHQGKGNVLLFPRNRDLHRERGVQCRKRLGGLLRYYDQEAA
jgi:putative transposase